MLLIDVGNTSLKWKSSVGVGSIKSSSSIVESELLSNEVLLAGNICVSSVFSDEGTSDLVGQFRSISPSTSIYLAKTLGQCESLQIAYADSDALGVDRWLAMLAAADMVKGSVCVIDSGSALTVDFVDDSGVHLGGWIMPGFPLLYRSLNQSTQRIDVVEASGFASQRPGKSTQECVSGGVAMMFSGAIREVLSFVERLEIESIVLTGGDAGLISSSFGAALDVKFAPDLVFDGLEFAFNRGYLLEV